jgi:hypothetical protein
MYLPFNRNRAATRGCARAGVSLAASVALQCLAGPLPAHAASVRAIGSLSSTLAADIDEDVSDFDLVVISKEVQTPLPGSLHAVQSYYGVATHGRLSARTHASAQVSGSYPIPPGVSATVQALTRDEIIINNAGLNDYLRLEISLSGFMKRQDLNAGNGTTAAFFIGVSNLENDEESTLTLLDVSFQWLWGLVADPTTTVTSDFGFPGFFTAYPDEDIGFRSVNAVGEHPFGGSGYLLIPLAELGATFTLNISVLAHSNCSETSTSNCLARTNFGNTALIGGAQIVDGSGNVVAGASLLSASGYDYITPPPAPVPLPGALVLLLSCLPACAALRRRQTRLRIPTC